MRNFRNDYNYWKIYTTEVMIYSVSRVVVFFHPHIHCKCSLSLPAFLPFICHIVLHELRDNILLIILLLSPSSYTPPQLLALLFSLLCFSPTTNTNTWPSSSDYIHFFPEEVISPHSFCVSASVAYVFGISLISFTHFNCSLLYLAIIFDSNVLHGPSVAFWVGVMVVFMHRDSLLLSLMRVIGDGEAHCNGSKCCLS